MTWSARSILRVPAALLSVGACLFVLLELTIRIYLFGLAGVDPTRVNSVHGLAQSGFVRRSADARLTFELKPNVDDTFHLARFRTNSRGLRDREYPFKKPGDTFRVAVLGSSFTLPTGVAIDDAYHSVLERELTAAFAPRRYEFINFAVGMYTAEQILSTYELRALDYDPDLALVGVTAIQERWIRLDPASNWRPAAKRRPRQTLITFGRTYPALQSFLVRFVVSRSRPGAYRFPVGFLEERYMDLISPGTEAPETDDRFSRMLPAPPFAFPPPGTDSDASVLGASVREGSVLERLASLQRTNGIPIVLAGLEIGTQERWRKLEREARELDLLYCDTRRAFRGIDTRELWIHPLDPHPDARGHSIFAREIGTCLRRSGLLDGKDATGSNRSGEHSP